MRPLRCQRKSYCCSPQRYAASGFEPHRKAEHFYDEMAVFTALLPRAKIAKFCPFSRVTGNAGCRTRFHKVCHTSRRLLATSINRNEQRPRLIKRIGLVGDHTLHIQSNDEECPKFANIGPMPMLPGSMSPAAPSTGTARSAPRIQPFPRRCTACTVWHSAARHFARNRLALEGEVSWLVCR